MATEKLISADSLYKAFLRHMAKRFDRELCASGENCKGCYPGCSWRHILEMEPAVDAVEVVRGEWTIIEDDYCGLIGLECSHCEKTWWFDEESPIGEYHFCPGCGADMRGDGNGA